jgi:hypothetical protein
MAIGFYFSTLWKQGTYLIPRHRKPRPRRNAWISLKARTWEKTPKKRPAWFKPGPYKDGHGNLRFLRRDKCKP